jgi:hypothetical protein
VKDGVAVGLSIQSETMFAFGIFLTCLMKPIVSGVEGKADLAVERGDMAPT